MGKPKKKVYAVSFVEWEVHVKNGRMCLQDTDTPAKGNGGIIPEWKKW